MSIQLDGPEKAYDADITIAAHAVCVRTTMLSLASNLKGSQVFKLQDEHNASFFQNVVDWIAPTRPQSYENIMRFSRAALLTERLLKMALRFCERLYAAFKSGYSENIISAL